MELEEGGKEHIATLTLDITNRVRNKVRKSLRKSYRKFMKHSDIEAVEKALFQYYDDKFDDGFLYLTEDDISDIEQIFGGNDNWREPVSMERDFSIEEILDMPTEGEVQMNLSLLILIAWNRMNYAKWCPLRLVCSSKQVITRNLII